MTIDGVKNLYETESLANLNKYVDGLLSSNLYTKDKPLYNGDLFLAYKQYVSLVSKELETTKGLTFTALQTTLKAMNSGPVGTGKLYNPLAPLGPPPFGQGQFTDSLDVPMAFMNPRSERVIIDDKLAAQKNKQIQVINNKLNMYDENNKFFETYYYDTEPYVEEQESGKKIEVAPGISLPVPDYEKIFTAKIVGPDFGSGEKGYKFFEADKKKRKGQAEIYTQKRKSIENADAFFTRREVSSGYIDVLDELQDDFSDNGNYMPFFLEDLRAGGKKIYLRAFFSSLRESISPEWSQEKYFGRIEPVGTYLGTQRSVSINFAMVAFSRVGFTAMWRKLNTMAKLLYPTYKNGVMVKSPVCRLRIGDLITDEAGAGLAGYISSPIELDYSNSPWEITAWTGNNPDLELGKAPQMALVSFTFQVIHERNPSIDENYNFDSSIFRRVGSLGEERQLQDSGGQRLEGNEVFDEQGNITGFDFTTD